MIDVLNSKDWRLMSQRQRMSPFPNYMSMEAMTGLSKKYVGEKLDWVMLIFEDRIMNGFTPAKSFLTSAQKIVERINNNVFLYKGLVKQQNYWGKQLVRHSKVASRLVSNKVSSRLLYNLWKKYEQLYKEVYAGYGAVWIIEDVFNAQLLEIVKLRIKSEVKAAEILNTLTLQPRAMVARLERQALLNLAVRITVNDKWRRQVLAGELKTFDAGLLNLVKAHERKFFWVTRDYEDPVLDRSKIVSNLQTVLRGAPRKNLSIMVRELVDWEARKKSLTKELSLSIKEQQLFNAMRDVAYLKELRKRYVSESLYHFDAVLSEIGRRGYLSLKQVRFLKTDDLDKILFKKADVVKEINERIKLSVWLASNGRADVLIGKKAQSIKKKFIEPPIDRLEFTGTPVSPGIARGPVRIILNPDECNKVKKGDIIVSIQVVPSFSAAIQRAAGLICDGGHGITTHPAILAREAKIPAIIQTRFAREILKDGDMVEVNGYTGIARKVVG